MGQTGASQTQCGPSEPSFQMPGSMCYFRNRDLWPSLSRLWPTSFDLGDFGLFASVDLAVF